MRIFVCEQDAHRAKLIQDVLGVYNYKVITVNNSTDFFKKVRNQRPTVIVLNELFAQQSGLDLLRRLRKNPVTSRVPVIYIRPDASGELSSSAFDELTEFVNEPIKIKNLRHYIDRWTTFKSLYIQN